MASHNGGGSGGNSEPSFAPQAGRWYNLTLGASFKDNSTKFCTLRYEFKPASIDKNQAGSLHKNKDNRVTVEFNNNQPGKPKVTFEGSSEDYKENDGALFFDGEAFRLERLHRAVKRLRHVRMPGESNAAAVASASASAVSSGIATEARSPPLGKTAVKSQPFTKSVALSVPVEVEKIDIGEPDSPGAKPTSKSTDYHTVPPSLSAFSPEKKATEEDDNLHLIFGDDDDDDKADNHDTGVRATHGFDVNLSNQNDSDDELADVIAAVNASDDEGDKGLNAAEAIRTAEENVEDDQQQTSSSSGSSGSDSRSSGSGSGSGSGTASSSSDSEASDDDSASSGGDIDI